MSTLNQKCTLKNGTWIGVDDAYHELFLTFARALLEEITIDHKTIAIVVKEINVLLKCFLKSYRKKPLGVV